MRYNSFIELMKRVYIMNSFNAHAAIPADFLAKLPMYKTAFSPANRTYVGIVSVDTSKPMPIVTVWIDNIAEVLELPANELTNYCL
jgi:3'-phosphoadenosine 5'-phosphosulfate sulfotransferase (PAPS reductase)/FAD synthetase